ncbi:hypothetical protein MTR_1g067500 [Medicago truncatula]|uniref:Uncharacterized protein n=1 Tax=Medicago truncatula TaxID=3880 RepID=A0A072VLQ1_MEDTR|nr:hypothetical protein MTR_1g067500 [Medicago truncatula]
MCTYRRHFFKFSHLAHSYPGSIDFLLQITFITIKVLNNGRSVGRDRVKVVAILAVTDVALEIAVVNNA